MPSERILRQIDRLLDEADAAISQFDWEEVRRCAQAVLALDPANTDGVAVLAAADRALLETSPSSSPSPLSALAPSEAESPAFDPQPASDQQPGSDQGTAPETLLPSPLGREGERRVDDTHALDSLARGVFVGRQYEMGELRGALEDALSGRGRMVMLVGEPGVGKSRTAQELAAYAKLRGAQILWGRCYEERGMPPYWPWVQAMRSYVRETDPARLQSELGAGGADIAEIVAEVGERLPDIKPPPALEPDQARFRLFDSIATFLRAASQNQPLVVALDNLHWADKPSLLFLEFLAQELVGTRLLIIGTYRDAALSRHHPLSQILGELTKEQLFQRVLLRGLNQEDVRRFIELVAGISPPDNLVATVYQQTEGNPLFVTEVVRLLVQEGELTPLSPSLARGDLGGLRHRDSWNVRIPEGVREVIGRRLDRLSEGCNQTLTVASVIGREFTLEQLAPLLEDITSDRLLEVLEEASVARIIEEQAVGQYQFSHNMIQRTLVDELSTTRKVRLHARIAEALENLYQANAGSHAVELAYHFSEAATVSGPEKLALYSSLAGERALLAYAWEEALIYFQQALSTKEGQAMDSETAALWFGLGKAQAATLEADQIQAAVTSLRRSFDYYAGDYYAGVGDVEPAVGVAEYPFPLLPGRSTGVAQLIESALALVPPDSHGAGRLLSQKIRVLVIEKGDFDGAQEAFSRALDIARREGDEALEMRILASATVADVQYLRLQGGLVKSLRAIELASLIDDPHTEVDARFYSALGLWWMGDLEGLFRQAQMALIPAEQLRDRYWLASSLWTNEIPCSLSGDWGKAREFNDRCLAVAPTDPRPLYTRALLESEVGDFDQAETHLDRLLEVMRRTEPGPTLVHAWTAMAAPIIQRISGVVDRLDIAEAAARTVLSAAAPTPYVAMMTRAGLGLLAVLRKDAAAAEQQYDAPRSGPGIMVPSTFMPFIRMVTASFMSTARLLALLAQTSGKLDLSVNHFEDGLLFCRRVGYRPELAWTCCDYADLLLQLGAPDQREQARLLLKESLTITKELGMVPLEERVTERFDRIGAPKAVAKVYPDGLTRREVDVLRLVASGKSKQDIAEELFISLRTVANHVTNILGKINASNRTEAAIYAARQGLT